MVKSEMAILEQCARKSKGKYFFLSILIFVSMLQCSEKVLADLWHPQLMFANVSIRSSELTDENTKYPLYQLIDGDPRTTWVFDISPFYGIKGEKWLEVKSTGASKIKTISLINGYAKSELLYEQNDRIRQIVVKTDEGGTYTYDLQETLSPQTIVLPKAAKSIRMTFTKILPGAKYADTCISELGIFNESGSDLITNPVYVFRSSGEYPYVIIRDRTKGVLFDFDYCDGILEFGFSPDESRIYLLHSELDGGGFDIYHIRTQQLTHYFDDERYVTSLLWLNNSRVKVEWYKYRDGWDSPKAEGISVIDL